MLLEDDDNDIQLGMNSDQKARKRGLSSRPVYKVASWSQVLRCNNIKSHRLQVTAGSVAAMAPKRARNVEGTKEENNSDALQRIKKLLLVIQKSESVAANRQPASVRDAMVTNQASGILQTETKTACISGIDSRTVQVERAVTRLHSCEYHLKWMDPLLWSTLPSDLMELIFGTLSLAKIIDLCALSMQCSTMCKSFNFRKLFAQRNPKLFELVGRDKLGHMLCDVVYDVKCNEPTLSQELGGTGRGSPFMPFPFGPRGQGFSFRRVHDFSEYVFPSRQSDGGLVCFVPRQKLLNVPILVGNPSADEWKALPCIPLTNKKTKWDPVRVQLVMNGLTTANSVAHHNYRVIVVFYHPTTKAYDAYCFDSRLGGWRSEESSLSYGDGCSRLLLLSGCGNQCNFDRITKMLYDLVYCSSLKGSQARTSAMVEDRLFVLHHRWPIDRSLHDQ